MISATFLPLGSVVTVRGDAKKYMIYGRAQKSLDNGRVYDYIACEYPQGTLDTNQAVLFNTTDILKVYYIGFQDEEEMSYNQALSDFWRNTRNKTMAEQ